MDYPRRFKESPLRPDQLPHETVPAWAHPKSREYLISRKISQQEAEGYTLGYAETGEWRNRLIIPMYDDAGELIAYQGRELDGREPRYRTNGPRPIFRPWSLQETERLYVVEGPFDQLALARVEPMTVATLGIQPSKNQIAELIQLIQTVRAAEVVLWFDVGATEEVYNLQMKLQPHAKISVLVDLDHKDPGDMDPDEIANVLNTFDGLEEE